VLQTLRYNSYTTVSVYKSEDRGFYSR